MTQETEGVTRRRAQIFQLLRGGNEDEDGTRVLPKYLDDATAALLIQRAAHSFDAPPAIHVANAPALSNRAAPSQQQFAAAVATSSG